MRGWEELARRALCSRRRQRGPGAQPRISPPPSLRVCTSPSHTRQTQEQGTWSRALGLERSGGI